jgi:hypothetical protein
MDSLELRRLALEAECDVRSMARQLRGEDVRGIVGDRIRRILRERGLLTQEQKTK